MNDLVSIITPSYNTADYIGVTIESALNQTYENWEMIIVDDCSTDNTDAVVYNYLLNNSKVNGRIKYLKNKYNSGAAVSRNRALLEAKGRWIAFLDSDDIWEKEKLEKQILFMESNNYHFSYTQYEEIDEKNNALGVIVTGPSRISKFGMYAYCWPGCLTVMYDKNIIGTVQIENIKKNNDYAIWLKVCKIADGYLLNEKLAKYRKRKGSISNHRYTALIKWHYKLWRKAEGKNPVFSLFWTGVNMFFGIYKKIKYVKTS